MPTDLYVIHHDAQLLAVHKPAGQPVHRLDKGTSGVLLLALDAATRSAGTSRRWPTR
jgi:23S rRNA-/tRNA-specific pseudouridylate synthase